MRNLSKFLSSITIALVIGCFSLGISSAHAMSGAPGKDKGANAGEYDKAVSLINLEKYDEAIALLKSLGDKDAKPADISNYLGYAHRQKGDYDAALGFYQQALKQDPEHKGAHEYLGELYIKTGKLDDAKKMLDSLDDICTFGCAEFSTLKRKIAEAAQS